MKAVRQVVFTDVLIVGWHNVDGQSYAPIGLHKIDASSDWLLIKRHCIGVKPAAALIKANICQFLSTLLKSISWDSPFK
jgi:hypothetical protein